MFLLRQQFMSKAQSKVGVWVVVSGVALVVQTVLAVDVKIDFDKAFDFKAAHTWAWNPDGAGKVMMARTPDDDAESMKKLAEPIIMTRSRNPAICPRYAVARDDEPGLTRA